MVGKISELTKLTDVDDDLDEFEVRDQSDTPNNDVQNKTWSLGNFKGMLPVKIPVRVATTVNGTLATAYENGDTVDGIVLATGNRILLKNQTTGSENGIYTVNASGAPTRALDFNTSAKVKGSTLVIVQEGTTNADKAFQCTTNEPITLGTTALVFAEFGAGGGSLIVMFPIVMEVPNDTVSYPDIHAFATQSTKHSVFTLPNSGASEINWKCVCPANLAASPAAKIVIYMYPQATVANSTVNLQIKRRFVSSGSDLDVAFSGGDIETAIDIDLTTSTVENLMRYEYALGSQPTANQIITGILKRDPAATNDDYTNDLDIIGMFLQITVTPA